MRAYLIDPFNSTTTELDFVGDYRDIQRLLQVNTFDCVTINPHRDTLYVDDDGLLKITDETRWFYSPLVPQQAFAGRGLVLGATPSGNNKSAWIELSVLQAGIRYLSTDQVRGDVYAAVRRGELV